MAVRRNLIRYWYECEVCDYAAERYPNVKVCPRCGGNLIRSLDRDETHVNLTISDSVQSFADRMKRRMLGHAGDWGVAWKRTGHPLSLYDRILEKTMELRDAINDPDGDSETVRTICADIANFAMMTSEAEERFRDAMNGGQEEEDGSGGEKQGTGDH